jgi:hypothetical protein
MALQAAYLPNKGVEVRTIWKTHIKEVANAITIVLLFHWLV